MLHDRWRRLEELIRSFESCVVAYSGGVDSAFLACVAHRVLGSKALAVIADSPSLPRRELDHALALARQFEFPVRVVRTQEFSNPDYLKNPENRCYFCKSELFTELEPLAREEGFQVIAYGENASDQAAERPGAQAAAERRIRAPLKEAGLTKADIREMSAALGLPTADKPQLACLSSRIPHGEPVSPEKLAMVEAAENFLRDLGFYDVRVRHHTLAPLALPGAADRGAASAAAPGAPSLARIEIGAGEFSKMFEQDRFVQVAEALRRIGYLHATLDLRAYRGSGASATPAPRGT